MVVYHLTLVHAGYPASLYLQFLICKKRSHDTDGLACVVCALIPALGRGRQTGLEAEAIRDYRIPSLLDCQEDSFIEQACIKHLLQTDTVLDAGGCPQPHGTPSPEV